MENTIFFSLTLLLPESQLRCFDFFGSNVKTTISVEVNFDDKDEARAVWKKVFNVLWEEMEGHSGFVKKDKASKKYILFTNFDYKFKKPSDEMRSRYWDAFFKENVEAGCYWSISAGL